MGGIELETNGLIAFGHHRIGQTNNQDSLLIKMADKGMGFGRIPDEKRHHWMRTADRFKAEHFETVAKLSGPLAELAEQMQALRAIADIHRPAGRGAIGQAERVGINIGIGLLPYRLNDRGARRDKSTIDTKGLTESTDDNIRLRATEFRGAAAACAVGANTVGIIDHGNNAIAKPVTVALGNSEDGINRRIITAHAENTVKNDHDPINPRFYRRQAALKAVQVIMTINGFVATWYAGNPHRPDNGIVIELITDPKGIPAADGEGQATVGGIGRIENLGGRHAGKLGNTLLQDNMLPIGAINEPYRPRPNTKGMGCLICDPDQLGMMG